MASTKAALCVLAVGVLLCGCGPAAPLGGVTAAFQQHRPGPDAKVAVLPFTNETADMDIAPTTRKGIAAGFRRLGYSVMDLDECDARLREGGITQAGQLAAVERQKLGELVGADLVIFGEVEDFRKRAGGVPPYVALVKRIFKSSFRMVHAPSGETLWVARGDTEHVHDPNDDRVRIASALQKAVSTFRPSKMVDEEELEREFASRSDAVLVVFEFGSGFGLSDDVFFVQVPWVLIGRSRLQLETGLCWGQGTNEPVPGVQRRVYEFDLGVRRTWREDAVPRPFLSGGLSVARTVYEFPGAEETIVMPYATAGVNWWLGGFDFGMQMRLSTIVGGAGLGFSFATVF